MKHLQTSVLALILAVTSTAFAQGSFESTTNANYFYRNAGFTFGTNSVNYTFGSVSIGLKQATPITQPFTVQYPNGTDVDTAEYLADGGSISDPFSLAQGTETNSTDMSGLLTYMSSQSFAVESGMSVSYQAEESVQDPSFGGGGECSMTSATVELVNAANGSVLATVRTMPSLCSDSWFQHQASKPKTYSYDLSSYAGMNVYIRMNIQETETIPFTSYATTYSSESDLGWSPYDNSQQTTTTGGLTASPSNGNKRGWGKEIASSTSTDNLTVLEQNYPNPVVSTTSIAVDNVAAGSTLRVYDMLGRVVADLSASLPQNQAHGEIEFNAANLPTGVYMYRLETASGLSLVKQLSVQH